MPIRNVITACMVLLLVTVMASGCLGTKTPPAVSPAPPAIFLDYHRIGGIAGFDDRLVIFDNGAAVISTRAVSREFQVNQSERSTLDRLFREAGFETLQGNYTSRHGGADLMRYSISWQNRTVIAEDTAVPGELQPAIRELNAIIGAARSQDLSSGSFAGLRT
jgi:hypothetical protein